MKHSAIFLCALGAAMGWCAGVAWAQAPMDTAFTYQGNLTDRGID